MTGAAAGEEFHGLPIEARSDRRGDIGPRRPVLSWSVAALVGADILAAATARPLLDLFGPLAWAGLVVLGPVGIAIAGRSAGIGDALTWVAWLIVPVPAFVVVWFVGVAALSGALGNPF